ncbi:hypothetical protein K431DRAFT_290116 [Polychaeton citri CBS 116435]|uniref:Uncharacterized protein n=1 Tax=Polychaeton citri CBS 116435 TaxID=1314669 RepID=A0A9P4QGY5_9PEZI|nr:hypothetical protein K431DRAFT_290116 [Polychaeton citri CBS 116435]
MPSSEAVVVACQFLGAGWSRCSHTYTRTPHPGISRSCHGHGQTRAEPIETLRTTPTSLPQDLRGSRATVWSPCEMQNAPVDIYSSVMWPFKPITILPDATVF